MRRHYTMTTEELAKILEAHSPKPALALSGMTPQECAEYAWLELGVRMGFDPMTVEPGGQDPHDFTAEEKL